MHTTLLTHRALRKKPFVMSLTKQAGFYSLQQAQARQSSVGVRMLLLASCIMLGILLATLGRHAFAEEEISTVAMQKNIITYTINLDGTYKMEHEYAMRLENSTAVAIHGERKILYTPSLESMQIIDAYTILPDGRRIPVPKKSIHTTIGAMGIAGPVFKDSNTTVLIYPNLVVGSHIYLKYVTTCHTPLFPGHFTFNWSFSPHLKSAKTEANLIYDPRLKLRIAARGVEGGALPVKDGLYRYRYIHTQQKILPYENNEIASADEGAYVQASTFENYAQLGAAYQEKLKEKVNVTPEIQKLANELTSGVTHPIEQTRLLYNWVSKNIRYVGAYIGNGGYVPHDSQTILSNRWGDCKDHVVILEALLAAKGIASSATLINTGNSYKLPKLAVLNFDHLITYVPSLNLYLDSTAQFAPLGTLPRSELEKPVLLTALGKLGKTPRMRASENTATTTVKMKILPDGTIQGSSKVVATGTSDITLRKNKANAQSLTQEKVAEILLDVINLSGKGSVHSGDPADLNTPLEVNATFTLDPVSNFPGPGALTIPAGVVDDVISIGILTKPKEKYNLPVRCDSFRKRNQLEIEFPPTSKITRLPTDVHYEDATIRYDATYTLKGNTLTLKRNLIIQNRSMVCGEAEYELDKKFYPVFQRDLRAQVLYE
jgi:hypothetical protein